MRYQDFELEISRNGTESNYIAKVRSPQGETSEPHFFNLPDAVTLENLILKMRKFSRSSRASNCPEVQAASRFGELLFSNAFGGEISNLLKSCLDQTSNDSGLRIKLILQDAPELSALPWEFLYLPTKRDFLAHSPATPIVRYLKHATAIKPLAVTLPLKLLVVIASPTDKVWLDTEAERQTLEQALADLVTDGTLQITWLEHATVASLAEALEQNYFHLLHFIGHSYFDDKLGEGALILEDAAGKSHYYDASRLKVLLHDHHTLRLVVLNSCEGAMSDEQDPFSSIATTLMLAGIPAVIAMQFEISDAAAISFAKVFYKWLAKGTAIDEAMGKSRKHLFAVEGNNVEWGTPVLYLRAKDGELFDVAAQDLTGFKNLSGLEQKSMPHKEEAITQVTTKNYVEGNVSGGNVAGNDITTVGEDVVSGNKTEIHYHYASQANSGQEKQQLEKELEKLRLELKQLAEEKIAQEKATQAQIKKLLENTLKSEAPERQKIITLPNNVTLEMVYIPAGEFLMGAAQGETGASDDEYPQHKVKVPAFYMAKYPVTQAQYQAVMGENPSRFKGSNNPVEQVSWHDAKNFCQKLSALTNTTYRLPSEAEWEYACRAGTTTRWWFGNDEAELEKYAWYAENSDGKTMPVGQKPANPFGLYDMHGNVWEWCEDVWHGDYNGAPLNATAWVDNGSVRVLRGGSWGYYGGNARSAYRGWLEADLRDYYLGFRFALGLPAR